jgi:hypothetical protein
MEHNIVAIEDENMILCETDNSASIEFDMQDAQTFIDDDTQPMYMQEEDRINDTCIVPLRTLMDIDTVVTSQSPTTGTFSLTEIRETSEEKVCKRKKRGSYRRFTDHQIEQLFEYVSEQGNTAKNAALLTGINIRTAQHYIKKYNDDERRFTDKWKKIGNWT